MTVDGAALTLTIPSTASGQRVAVSFTATAGQAVYFNLTHGANTQSAFGATPSLTGPNGPIPLPITGAALYGSTNLEPPIGLTRTGTYTLYLNTPADGYGALTLQAFSAYVTASLTAYGTPASVTIPSTASGQRVAVNFTAANAEQAVSISYRGTSNLNLAAVSLSGPWARS